MEIARSLIEEMEKASLIIFKIAGSQIVHQLLGVGHILFNASRYDQDQHKTEVKRLISFLSDLVSNLEHDVPSAAEAGAKLQTLAEAAA
jgi:hypothetical protein